MAVRLLIALLTLGLCASATMAQDAAEFFKGRQINLVVGYGTGGGYDVYGRVLARHMGRHLPGSPNIVIQNMPGAGSLVATNHLYNIAPKDGSTFGIFARNMAILGLLASNPNVKFDPRKLTWLGSSSSYANDAYTLLVRRDAKVRSLDDLRRADGPALVMGTTAEGGSSDAFPTILRDLLGMNVKAISGYRDSGILFLAMERGEVEARGVGLSAINSNKPEWLKPGGLMHVLLVFGRETRFPGLPEVPTARELAKGERERQLIEVLEVAYKLSRPFAAPPGIPADRARLLRDAFIATHKDPQYLAEAEKAGLDVSPIGGDEILKLIERVARTPADQLKSIEKLIEGG